MILLKLFWEFFKIGLFTFGGGYAMIPLFEREIVNRYRWLTMEQFADILAIAEMTPGPFAVNTATFVGYKVASFWGSFFSTLGVVLPSFITILLVASVFLKFQYNSVVQSAFRALRPAVAGLIVVAALSVGRIAITDFRSVLMLILVVLGVYLFKVHPILALILAGIAGMVFFR
jgi:chromate transporter